MIPKIVFESGNLIIVKTFVKLVPHHVYLPLNLLIFLLVFSKLLVLLLELALLSQFILMLNLLFFVEPNQLLVHLIEDHLQLSFEAQVVVDHFLDVQIVLLVCIWLDLFHIFDIVILPISRNLHIYLNNLFLQRNDSLTHILTNLHSLFGIRAFPVITVLPLLRALLFDRRLLRLRRWLLLRHCFLIRRCLASRLFLCRRHDLNHFDRTRIFLPTFRQSLNRRLLLILLLFVIAVQIVVEQYLLCILFVVLRAVARLNLFLSLGRIGGRAPLGLLVTLVATAAFVAVLAGIAILRFDSLQDQLLEFVFDLVDLFQLQLELWDLGDVAQVVALVQERTLELRSLQTTGCGRGLLNSVCHVRPFAVTLLGADLGLFGRHHLVDYLLALDLDLLRDGGLSLSSVVQVLIFLDVEIGFAEVSGLLLGALLTLLDQLFICASARL